MEMVKQTNKQKRVVLMKEMPHHLFGGFQS